MAVKAFGTPGPKDNLHEMQIKRRDLQEDDISIDILYSGVCHSDIHVTRNDWGGAKYPVVPGHEIVGRVKSTGNKVTKYKEGDLVGVGVFVDSCGYCSACKDDLESYCETPGGMVGTYNSPDKFLGGHTYGGYSKNIVVKEHFVLKVSEKLDTKAVAPLLCAGITSYSPLKHWKIKKGDKVAVAGFGGLGHMGIKFAVAMGAEVSVITRGEAKKQDAIKLGAKNIIDSTKAPSMLKYNNYFDFILNTIPVKHDMNPYLALLKRDKTMCIVGAFLPFNQGELAGGSLIAKRKNLAGSLVGGIKETQEMLDFCAEHNITCDVEMIKMNEINEAYEKVIKGDVKYRFVIDMQSF